MKSHVGDYCVILDQRNKKHLVQVTKTDGTSFSGVFEDKDRDNEATRTNVEFERKDILANLGKNPFTMGSVFGIQIEKFYRSKNVRHFGMVNIYRDLTESEEKAILAALKKQGSIFHQRGWLPDKAIEVEIRNPKGKWAGTYHWKSNPDIPDIMTLRPKDLENIEYVVTHEAFHGTWFNKLTKAQQIEWIDLFAKYTILHDVTKDDLRSLLRDLKDSGSWSVFAGKADEEQAPIIKEIMKYIISNHKLTRHDIDDMLAEEHDIEFCWPKRPIHIGRKEGAFVSEYAKTKVAEFFAESASWWHLELGEVTPEVRKLLKKHVKSLS